MAQPVEHLPYIHEVVGLSPWDRIFSHICAHFGILGRCGITLSQFWLRGQLQYRTALWFTSIVGAAIYLITPLINIEVQKEALLYYI